MESEDHAFPKVVRQNSLATIETAAFYFVDQQQIADEQQSRGINLMYGLAALSAEYALLRMNHNEIPPAGCDCVLSASFADFLCGATRLRDDRRGVVLLPYAGVPGRRP